MNFEQEINQLKDTAMVMAEIQRRQAQVRKLQAELLDEMREGFALHEKRMQHIDLTLSEAGDKLNGMIGWIMDHFQRPPQ